ncbi:MAG: hypothetical protein EA422_04435 [Gemmatimonadales bacterium]|nr:MAG: hypothetical protein EA422_04435 [Gemmatimonadales bacterium]
MPQGRRVLIRLYHGLEEVYQQWRGQRSNPDWESLEARIARLTEESFVARVESLVHELPASRPDGGAGPDATRLLQAGKVLHDIRGGGFTSLVVYSRALEEGLPAGLPQDDLRLSAVFLARDHAKMMRNALPWIDPEGRRRDLEEQPHRVEALLGKWRSMDRLPSPRGASVSVKVAQRYDGLLASCCLEVSALERVLSNLLANAVRFAIASPIRVEVDPVEPDAVRWLVANRIAPDDAAWLHERCRGEAGHLFRSRVAGGRAGGEGLGLATCADFVCAAFGLEGVDQALQAGYLGAWWGEGWFMVWVHWPALAHGDDAVPAS